MNSRNRITIATRFGNRQQALCAGSRRLCNQQRLITADHLLLALEISEPQSDDDAFSDL